MVLSIIRNWFTFNGTSRHIDESQMRTSNMEQLVYDSVTYTKTRVWPNYDRQIRPRSYENDFTTDGCIHSLRRYTVQLFSACKSAIT